MFATWQNYFIRAEILWIRSVLHTIEHIVCEQRRFYFLLSDLDAFVAFSCLIALDGVLNRGTEAAQSVLIQRRGFSSSHKVWSPPITAQRRSPWTWVPYPPCLVPLFLPAVLGPWKSDLGCCDPEPHSGGAVSSLTVAVLVIGCLCHNSSLNRGVRSQTIKIPELQFCFALNFQEACKPWSSWGCIFVLCAGSIDLIQSCY